MTEQQLSPFDVAIMNALMSIIEVISAKGIATHEDFALPFNHQMNSAMAAGNGEGAGVFKTLLDYCSSYGTAHALHRAEPGGHA